MRTNHINCDCGVRRIRIGTTITIRASILTNDEEASLVGRDIRVFLVDSRDRSIEIKDYRIVGEHENIVSFVFQGNKQTLTGIYRVEVYENYNGKLMLSLDKDAFLLVPRSKMERDGVDDVATPVMDLEMGVFTTGGVDGVGIRDIVQTHEAEESGGTNVITVYLDNDDEKNFRVRNGERGEKGDPGDTPDMSAYAMTNMEIDEILNF